jgi:WD40 repeat protein
VIYNTSLLGHDAGIWGLDISADSQWIASGSDDSTAILWTMGGVQLAQLNGHQEAVNTVSFSPDRAWLATGSADNTVILWNIENIDDLSSLLSSGCNWLSQREYESSDINEKVRKVCPAK